MEPQNQQEIVKGFTSLVRTTGISGENVTKLGSDDELIASSQEAMSQIESVPLMKNDVKGIY